ncbi:hypothetical protein B0A54_03224 [Friedmanniomyces endolithicus]|uniref:Uncharacterized protein n=1 Tax=Friedmanniomyces endolithicus TaxID=329885 RepID=A0A4U0V8J9_9PEZI|nr:hypothetical protein B0A54_03224 [Friedmanniomyces endolithicus]
MPPSNMMRTSSSKKSAVMGRVTALISGYADLTEDEFRTHYLDQLNEAIARGETFVMAASDGFAESKAPGFLSAKGFPAIGSVSTTQTPGLARLG